MLRSTISRSLAVVLLLGMVGVTGCGTNNDAAGNNKVRTNNVQGVKTGRLSVNSVNGRTGAHNITRLEMSQDLADRIAAMKDVRSANVLLAGDSAYVAVTLDEAGAGTHTGRTTNTSPRTLATGRNSGGMLSGLGGALTGRGGTTSRIDGTTYGMDGTMSSRTGTMTGIGGAMPGTGVGMNGTGAINGTAGGSGTSGIMGMGNTGTGGMATGGMGTRGLGTGGIGGGMGTSGSTSGAGIRGLGTGIGGTLGTGGMVTNRTGTGTGTGGLGTYGSGTGGLRTNGMGTNGMENNTTDTLSASIKNKVAAEIKRNAPQIKNVYVSDNPDFVQRVNGYADQARAGYPLQGFVNQFRIMVERIFPTRVNGNR